MLREIQDANMKIDSIQSCSGNSEFGLSPDIAIQFPGCRPASAGHINKSSGQILSRHHSAPPRRGNPGGNMRRPYTAMSYANVVEAPSDSVADERPPHVPGPFLQSPSHKVSSKLSDYIATATGTRTADVHKQVNFSGTQSGMPISSFNKNIIPRATTAITYQSTPKRSVSNPNNSDVVKAIRQERVMAYNSRNRIKKTPPKTSTFVRPALLNLKYKNIMETKVAIQKFNQDELDHKLNIFLDAYPRSINKFAIKSPYLMSI